MGRGTDGSRVVLTRKQEKDAHVRFIPKPKKDEETGTFLPNGAAAKSGLNKSILDAAWEP